MRIRSKYGNTKVIVGGERFDSAGEQRRYVMLQVLERAGEIQDLERQVEYELQPKFTDNEGKKHRAINCRWDFRYKENGRVVVEDFKGFPTPEFLIKEKLFRYRYRDIVLRIYFRFKKRIKL